MTEAVTRSRVDQSGLDLATRLGVIQSVRVVIGTAIGITAAVNPERFGGNDRVAIAAAIAYLVGTGWFEMRRRRLGLRSLRAVQALLVVDVAFVTIFHGVTTPPGGALLFVPLLHAIAVTGALSARAGISVGLGHAAGLFAASVGRLASDGDPDVSAYGSLATAVLAVTAGTAAIDAVRDRTIRRDLSDLDTLAELARSCELDGTVAGISAILRDTVCNRLGFEVGVVALAPEQPVSDEADARQVLLWRTVPDDAAEEFAALGDRPDVVVVPLVAGGLRYGRAAFAWPRGGRIPARTVDVVEQLCRQASLAIHNASLRDRIARMAVQDQLTGLPNRRAFDDRLAVEIARWERTGAPLALAVIDVDHFKAVNDTHGHATGDAVLAHLGARLAESIRAVDLAARFGGEEFAVILPSAALPAATRVAERIRRSLGDGTGPIPFTVSIGVAAVPLDGTTAEALFAAADDALYRAKHGGRNQVSASSSSAVRHHPLRAVVSS